jgi:hypothetical protein
VGIINHEGGHQPKVNNLNLVFHNSEVVKFDVSVQYLGQLMEMLNCIKHLQAYLSYGKLIFNVIIHYVILNAKFNKFRFNDLIFIILSAEI